VEALIHQVIGCCIRVHSALGPGLLEKIYVKAVCLEFTACGLPFESEKRVDVLYRGTLLCQQRLDIVVDGLVLLEVKAIDRLAPVHLAQVLSYLRVSKLRVGLLLNFNVAVLPDGLRRVVL
jgi:GxxExxY protein